MSLELRFRHVLRGLASDSSRRLHTAFRAPSPWRRVACSLALLVLSASSSLAVTVELRPLVSGDDAEQALSGSMYLNSSDLEMTMDAAQQIVGLRWTGLTVPKGAVITAAWIQFTAEETQAEATQLSIRAQAADNAPGFTATKGELAARATGSQVVNWAPAAWTVGQAGAAQRTPDLKLVVQQVVDRAGWASGNAIVMVISGTGKRVAYAQDGGATLAPLLHVEYTTGTPPPPQDFPPTASLTVAPIANPSLTVNASGAGSTDTDATPIASYRFDFGDGTPAVVTTAPTATASHTYASAGTYTVTLLVTDTGGLTSAPASASVTVSAPTGGGGPGPVATVELRPATSSDDAEQTSSGSTTLNSSDLELVMDSNAQTVGIRWPGLSVPRGATIVAAWVQFTAEESQTEATQLTLRSQAADNAPTFASTSNNITSRATGAASVSWSPSAWTAGQVGAAQRTPDVRALVQQVVSRAGWASGNAFVMIISGTGKRVAYAQDGNTSRSALLHVEYTTDGSIPDLPPVAQLGVTQVASPALTVSASGAASTDNDATPIASYRFEFGDGTAPVVTNAPTAVANHTYSSAGTYTVTLRVTDTGGLVSSPVTASITVTSNTTPSLAVYGGYYSTHHPDSPQPKPNPWQGSAGVVFVGTPDSPSGGWDTSAIRIDNNTGASVTLTCTVDIGSDRFALWGTRTVPSGQKLILAQTGFENFDGSDTNPAGCYGCNPNLCITQVQSTVPVIRITVSGQTTTYFDTQQILNTRGVDAAGCPPTSGRLDESKNWVRILSTSGTEPAAMTSSGEEQGTTRANELWFARPSPNPVNDMLSLRFHIARPGRVQLVIYDVAGRIVTTALDHELQPGQYNKLVPVRGIMAGRYYVQLRTPEGELQQAFAIVR